MTTSARGRARGRAPCAGPEAKRTVCNDCLPVCDVQRDARPTRLARRCTGVDLAPRPPDPAVCVYSSVRGDRACPSRSRLRGRGIILPTVSIIEKTVGSSARALDWLSSRRSTRVARSGATSTRERAPLPGGGSKARANIVSSRNDLQVCEGYTRSAVLGRDVVSSPAARSRPSLCAPPARP